MNTLKLLIKNVSNAFLPASVLDGIVVQGFSIYELIKLVERKVKK